jgi:hemerythrin
MPYFLWNATLMTGNAHVDADHRKLTILVDSLIAAAERCASAATISLESANLIAFATEHFEREDSEMLKIGYHDRARHVADHTRLLREVTQLKTHIESSQAIRALGVYDFLRGWLREHILLFDQPMIASENAFAGT